jgi:glycosyltransferase involved in cell wall biosynthesis
VSKPLPGITVALATHNDAEFVEECLESVRGIASEIVVADGASSDGTLGAVERYGARVIHTDNKLMLNVNKNLAIDAARYEWILLLDPDERVTPELAAELRSAAASANGHAGYWLPRRDFELGRWLHETSPQLRFFRNGSGRFPCEHIHEMVEVTGSSGPLGGTLLHEPRQSLFEYVHKRNLYSEHRARHLHATGHRFRLWRLLLRPATAFARSYLGRRGWRDGVPGLIIASSSAYGTFLQDAKLWQLEQASELDREVADVGSAHRDVVPAPGARS